MLLKKYIILFFTIISSGATAFASGANQDLISLFPLDKYDQTVSNWIKPNAADYDEPVVSSEMQKRHFDDLYDHYFGSSSPWDAGYVNKILHQTAPNDLKTIEQNIITDFSNKNKPDNQIGYGENFHPYAQDWIDDIANNINPAQLDNLTYQPTRRAIAIDNLHARVLPTDDPHFYSYKLAGQGYPFDNLQMSAIWAGTPLYILAETRDHAWSLVITPDFIAWAKNSGIAHASNTFVAQWENNAKQHLAAITKTKTNLSDEKGQFLLSAYIGTILPAENTATGIKVLVPVMDADHFAVAKYALVSADAAAFMPLATTPHNFATIMSSLLGRPYGWGSMYFYNDCSAELKSFYTPFGIWLPRHSSDQVSAGKMVDMTAAPADKRLAYLMENGRRYMTIVYIGGHVLMYLGNYTNPTDQSLMAMSYQNMWGLSPNPPIRRAVIGQSVLFPLLLKYPEDTSLTSPVDKKFFQVAYLDQLPDRLFKSTILINLRALMFPDVWQR